MPSKLALTLALAVLPAVAQTPDINTLLERLERVERENRALTEELRKLRLELEQRRDQPAVLEERVAVVEKRVEEQAQSKVESPQRFPVRLTGMLLFNAYTNGAHGGTSEYPTTAALNPGQRSGGGYMRQSIIGLEFHGPRTIAGGQLSGNIYMDFFAGTQSFLNHLFRIRTGTIQIDWADTTLLFGQEKPIFSPRNPDSLAQVGVSPMTNAGNPWLWQPQVRIEQRFAIADDTAVRAQLGVYQTNEFSSQVPPAFASSLARYRPALQGRVELRHRGLEVAPGFHTSTSHVAGTSVPSNALSVDWLFAPLKQLRFTGLVYGGANLAHLGTLRQGVTVLGPRNAIAVRTWGGWAQAAWIPTDRLSFHFMHGQNDDRDRDLRGGGFGKNQNWAANLMYRIAPNVIVAWESSQVRTTYIGFGTRKNNHHDLALAYRF